MERLRSKMTIVSVRYGNKRNWTIVEGYWNPETDKTIVYNLKEIQDRLARELGCTSGCYEIS